MARHGLLAPAIVTSSATALGFQPSTSSTLHTSGSSMSSVPTFQSPELFGFIATYRDIFLFGVLETALHAIECQKADFQARPNSSPLASARPSVVPYQHESVLFACVPRSMYLHLRRLRRGRLRGPRVPLRCQRGVSRSSGYKGFLVQRGDLA